MTDNLVLVSVINGKAAKGNCPEDIDGQRQWVSGYQRYASGSLLGKGERFLVKKV